MHTAKELLDKLNTTDETHQIEAKKGSDIGRSILESICAFSNEPNLNGGTIILGVERNEDEPSSVYAITGVANPNKLQSDIASTCTSTFNMPIRPTIEVENIDGMNCIKIYVAELQPPQKPLYFKSESLPRGAYRRIASSDQRCSDDDMMLFFGQNETFDSGAVQGTSLDDLDKDAIANYRILREKVNPLAEELSYSDEDLLRALGCIVKEENKDLVLSYAGLLVFGSSAAQRRLLPMVRVDYINVPGNEWVEDPKNRFTTIDMRGPLINLLSKIHNVIIGELPRGFHLPEGKLQAESITLPSRVLRESLVNALMHRSYRVNQPTQIIRYSNRIEIRNPGFSLKPEEFLGEPGSQTRNPFIAAVFHETNLAETKGSGIRAMKKLMEEAHMAPPTFDSDHGRNEFTCRLLLHHFLTEEDINWLNQFNELVLNDNQKRALIFAREIGAIDSSKYKQLNGCSNDYAISELRHLRFAGLLDIKGKGREVYYKPTDLLSKATENKREPNSSKMTEKFPAQPGSTKGVENNGKLKSREVAGEVAGEVNGEVAGEVRIVGSEEEKSDHKRNIPSVKSQKRLLELQTQMPEELKKMLIDLGDRVYDIEKAKEVIYKLCEWKDLSLREVSLLLLRRQPKYVFEKYIQPMIKEGKLVYTKPATPKHPKQKYRSKNY